ncbi:MAG: TonB-dependent receptor, partial [Bacteroidota bacterium]
AISDATAHIDPSELRNLGPSRTLVLINGKRKNQSAQVYLNDTPGRGEVGTDMKSIPAAAIERIEVLRDGAAAQYGSDAIAGVVNIILKERTDGQINAQYGVTSEGDGTTYGIDINKGFAVGKNGFLNLTGEYNYQDITDRAGEFASTVGDPLFGIPLGTSDELDQYFNDFPDLNMTYGQPEISRLSAMANFGSPYKNGKGELYGNLGYTNRSGKSFAFYRTSYWRDTDFGLLTDGGSPYVGYQPTFESDINDLTFTLGTRNTLGEWGSDLSPTLGSNSIDYTVNNSLNRSLEERSPTSFNPGGYTFGNQILNWDLSRSFDQLSLAFGAEFRREMFETKAGEEASYSPAPGTDSFPGLTPDNAVDEDRTNIGVYASADYDVNEAFLIGGAVRFENYSDFGSNFSWKVNSRYLIGETGSIRASVSTGFRAPSLHQIFLSNIQTTAGASGLIQEGTFSNVDDVTRNILGVAQLDAETSLNFTAGFTFKLADTVNISADYYNITVSDRVLFSDQIGAANFEGSALGDALAAANVDAFKFFINAADTRTSGLDIVLNSDNLRLGQGGNNLDITLAANFNTTEIDGEVTAPPAFGNVSIFGDVPANLLTSARPNTKVALGLNFDFDKFGVALNNTFFGEVTSPTSGQEFGSKIVTDLLINYDVADNFRIGITINNLLDVYPDRIDGELDPFGYRLQYPWRVSQFGFNGRYLKARASYNF